MRLPTASASAHAEARPAAAELSSGGAALELPGAMQERATLSKRRSISGAHRVKPFDQKLYLCAMAMRRRGGGHNITGTTPLRPGNSASAPERQRHTLGRQTLYPPHNAPTPPATLSVRPSPSPRPLFGGTSGS